LEFHRVKESFHLFLKDAEQCNQEKRPEDEYITSQVLYKDEDFCITQYVPTFIVPEMVMKGRTEIRKIGYLPYTASFTCSLIADGCKEKTTKIQMNNFSLEYGEVLTLEQQFHPEEYVFGNEYSIKVTNYSYGDAGGFTQPRHKSEHIISADEYKNEVMMLLGGRAAEEATFGYFTTGASEDLARAKRKVRAYYEVYHFTPYEVDKLDQTVEDTLWQWYGECVAEFMKANALRTLAELTARLITDRVLYTRDICNIIQTYY
jgi:hypothetical protein